MPTEAHPWHTSSASETDLHEEPKRREMTYLMEFLIMTAVFMFIMVVMIYTATSFLCVQCLMKRMQCKQESTRGGRRRKSGDG